MWDIPRYRIQAYIRHTRKARLNDKDRFRTELHLRRVAAEVRIMDGFASKREVISARLLLNDVTPEGLSIFTDTPLIPGQKLAITLVEPRRFYVEGLVVATRNVHLRSNILSESTFPHRVAVNFEFASPLEEETVRMFFEEIQLRYVRGSPS